MKTPPGRRGRDGADKQGTERIAGFAERFHALSNPLELAERARACAAKTCHPVDRFLFWKNLSPAEEAMVRKIALKRLQGDLA